MKLYQLLGLIVIGLNLADFVTTFIGLQLGFIEHNPFMYWLGPIPFFAYKLLSIPVFVFVTSFVASRCKLRGISLCYFLIAAILGYGVVNNVVLIWSIL